MMPDKWEQIRGNIKDNFTVEDEGREHVEEEGGIDIEFIIFASPIGRVKLEYLTKPLVLDKKTTYSKRIGSETKVEYVYSEDEKSYIFKAYKWSDENDDWIEIDSSSFA